MNIYNLKTFFHYRELIWELTLGEIRQKYHSSVLGYLWSLVEPLALFIILYIVFSQLMRITIEYYQLYLLLGILLWNFFTRGTSLGLSGIVKNTPLVTKIFFPREILIIAVTCGMFIVTLLEFLVFIFFLVFFQVPIHIQMLFFPVILLLFVIFIHGISLMLSALFVRYRDIQFIWPLILQAGFFLSPIFYTLDMFSGNIRMLLVSNPIAHFLNTSRDILLYGNNPSIGSLAYMTIWSVFLFIVGSIIFSKMEPSFAEEI